jgi:hypothetical protein
MHLRGELGRRHKDPRDSAEKGAVLCRLEDQTRNPFTRIPPINVDIGYRFVYTDLLLIMVGGW